jgi:DNA-binding transcriptional LysR family regulator
MQNFDGLPKDWVPWRVTKSRVTLSQLRAFVAVATHGSYSEAALVALQSQSTLSHAIQELERSLDAPVFERGRRGARLTELGKRLLEHAKQALEGVDALEQEAWLERRGMKGTIRIMSIRSAATFLLPPVMSEFIERFPNITFELLEEGDDDNPIEDAVRSGRADIGVLESPHNPDGLVGFELYRDDYLLLESKKRRASKSWQEVQKQPFILVTGGCTRHLREHWEKGGARLEPAFRIREDSVALGMVGQGMGISILPRLAVEPLPADVRASLLPTPLERVMSVVYTRRKLRQPALREFVASIRQTLT